MKAENDSGANVYESGGSVSRRSERKPSRQEHRAKPRGKSGRDASGELNGKPERYASERPHGQSRRNKPSEQHDRFGQSKPSEEHGRFGWKKPSEQRGKSRSNKLSEVHGQSRLNKPGEVHSQSGWNKPGEVHSQSGRNAPGEAHNQSGRVSAKDRLPERRLATELPRGKTELYSFESDISEASDVFEIRQYVVGEDKSEKLLSLLGFAARARRLVFGTELCRDAARAGQISLVVIAADASPNTKKRIVDACKYYGCDVCQSAVPSAILASRLGKSGVTAVVGLNDHNFIAGITALCARQTLDI